MINFQRAASEQGEEFRRQCVNACRYAGFEIVGSEYRVPDVGLTLDVHLRNLHGIDFLVECKGSMRGNRPGCMRTDTVKKAIANGFLLSLSEVLPHFPPMLLMTSHVAESGDALTMLEHVPTTVVLDVLNPYNHSRHLAWWARADDDAIRNHMEANPTLGELVRRRWAMCPVAVDD